VSSPVATGLPRPRAGFAAWWNSLSRWAKVALAVVAAALAYQVAASFVQGVAGPGTPTRGSTSSLDASPRGAGALAALLRVRGFEVRRLTVPLAAARPGPGTLMVLDPVSFGARDASAVATEVRAGRTVVVAGRAASSALRALEAPTPVWSASPVGLALVVSVTRFTAGVAHVDSPGPGAFVRAGGTSTLLAGDGGVLAVTAVAHGTLVALASSSSLANAQLASSDNAAFALNLARSPSRVVYFDEYDHGAGANGSGLAGLPAPWRFGLGLVLLGVALWILSAMVRLGPPRRRRRAGPPPRAAYVEAVATSLDQRPTDQRARAVRPLIVDLRASLARHLGLAPDAGPDEIAALAARLPEGHDDLASIAAVACGEVSTERDIIELGDARARLRQLARGGTR
jgi:hypothetical protein